MQRELQATGRMVIYLLQKYLHCASSYTKFNFQMETQQNSHKYKNLSLAVFLGVTHLHRAKTFTMFTMYIFAKCTKLKDSIFLLKKCLSVARLLLSCLYVKTILCIKTNQLFSVLMWQTMWQQLIYLSCQT